MKILLGLLLAVVFLGVSCQLPSASTGNQNIKMSLTIPFLKNASTKSSSGRFITGTAGEKIILSASTGSTTVATQVLDSNNNVTGYTATLTVPPVSGVVITATASANGLLFAVGSAIVDAKSTNPTVSLTLIPVPNAYDSSSEDLITDSGTVDFVAGQVYVFLVDANSPYINWTLNGGTTLSGNLYLTDLQGNIVSLTSGGDVVDTTGYSDQNPSFSGELPLAGYYYAIVYSKSSGPETYISMSFSEP